MARWGRCIVLRMCYAVTGTETGSDTARRGMELKKGDGGGPSEAER